MHKMMNGQENNEHIKDNRVVAIDHLVPLIGLRSGFKLTNGHKYGKIVLNKILLPERCYQHPQAWINLCWRLIMDIVPPRAYKRNPFSLPAVPGIYKITCIANKKIYVGSSISLRVRQETHFRDLRQNKHDNPHLQRAWNKYGSDAFVFEVLELVLTPELLTAREQYWFDRLKPFGMRGFNIDRTAGSPLGRKHTPEEIEKIRAVHLGSKRSPETIERMRQSKLGKKYVGEKYATSFKKSPEHREKLRQSHLGKKLSPEHIEKVRQTSIGRKKTPEQIEKQRQAVLGREKSPEAIENMRRAAQERERRLDAEIEAIKADRDSGMTYRQIIKKYGIGGTRLAQIFRGESHDE